MSSQFQRNIKCWQCSHPGQPLASTTSPLSPTLTLLSVYLRAGPVFSVKGTFIVSFSHICELCCVILPHIIMCFYSASKQNVTLPADCWFFCCGGTTLVPANPGGLCAEHLCLTLILYRTRFYWKQKVHMSKCAFLMWYTREMTHHSCWNVGTTEKRHA